MFVIESAGLSDTGKKRKDNEDTLLVDDGLGLYIVADGMGGTVAILFLDDRTFVAANVGDSSIFLVHKGRLEQLSVPHTVWAESQSANLLGIERLGAEFRHVLTRAMGVETTVKANICEVPCFIGDVLVICSDGLTDMVATEEILASVTRHPPAEACRELVDLANDRGGIDNISVIVLRIKKNLNGESWMKGLLSRVSEGFSSFGSKKR